MVDLPGGDSYVGPRRLFGWRSAPALLGRSTGARDADVACRLWQVSENLTGVTFPLLVR